MQSSADVVISKSLKPAWKLHGTRQTLLDLNVRYLGLLPEGKYNRDTLALYAGVVDQTKVDSGSRLGV